MEIFLDPKFIAIGFTINILISTFKPFLKINNNYKKLVIRLTVIVAGITCGYFYNKSSLNAVNGIFVDSCIITSISFIIYHFGMKQIVDKVKERL